MTAIVDFHTHSTASDGGLSPADLVLAAMAEHVDELALTDHDTVAGYLALRKNANSTQQGLRLLAGVEFSCSWLGRGIHMVGLQVDVDHPVLQQGVAQQQQIRLERSERIAEKLAKRGVGNIMPEVLELSGGQPPCRPHFAQALINRSLVPSFNQAFNKYLGADNLGNVSKAWPDINDVAGWIRQAGGVPVLAHPEAYELTRTKLGQLVDDFMGSGGLAIELAAVNASAKSIGMTHAMCVRKGIAASVGSDFHSSAQGWRRLGKRAPIPADVTPVWELPEFINSKNNSIYLRADDLQPSAVKQ